MSVHHVHDAVVDRRLRQFARVVAEARAPDRHQPLDVRFVDLAQRAVLVEMIAHAEGGDVFAVLAVVDQLLRGLGQRAAAPEDKRVASIFFIASSLVKIARGRAPPLPAFLRHGFWRGGFDVRSAWPRVVCRSVKSKSRTGVPAISPGLSLSTGDTNWRPRFIPSMFLSPGGRLQGPRVRKIVRNLRRGQFGLDHVSPRGCRKATDTAERVEAGGPRAPLRGIARTLAAAGRKPGPCERGRRFGGCTTKDAAAEDVGADFAAASKPEAQRAAVSS